MSTETITTQPATGSSLGRARADLPTGLKVTQLRVIRSEWLKFWSLRSSYITLGATMLAIVGFGALFSLVTANRWATMPPQEKLGFDPTVVSLRGFFLAQLVIGVLGVLVVSGEYGTGMIRSSLAAAPKRLPVLWAKAVVFAVISFVLCTASALAAFFVGQGLLSSQHIETTLTAPGVLRAVLGTGLYLTGVGLFGVALGWLIRHTAGAIGTVFGLLLVVPLLADALPADWQQHIVPYLPSSAGQQLTQVYWDRALLSPWVGFAVFCAYIAAGIMVAAVLLKRRDA